MASATAMYHSGHNTLKPVRRKNPVMPTVKGLKQRALHKAFLRYHDPDNWPALRTALKKMGRADLIGNGKMHLVPIRQPGKRHPIVAKVLRLWRNSVGSLPRNRRYTGKRGT